MRKLTRSQFIKHVCLVSFVALSLLISNCGIITFGPGIGSVHTASNRSPEEFSYWIGEYKGTAIFDSNTRDITGAYHCRAEFYLPNYGWVPVDPSDVAKLMLNENLQINDTKVIEARDYYFGAQTETYVDLSTGRDIILNPEQEAA